MEEPYGIAVLLAFDLEELEPLAMVRIPPMGDQEGIDIHLGNSAENLDMLGHSIVRVGALIREFHAEVEGLDDSAKAIKIMEWRERFEQAASGGF